MEKVVSMNIVEFINFLGEKDPRRRVEILGSWIKQSFIEQIEDSLNLALEGVQTEWLFKGLNEENITITAKTVDLFNDTDPEVIIGGIGLHGRRDNQAPNVVFAQLDFALVSIVVRMEHEL